MALGGIKPNPRSDREEYYLREVGSAAMAG